MYSILNARHAGMRDTGEIILERAPHRRDHHGPNRDPVKALVRANMCQVAAKIYGLRGRGWSPIRSRPRQ